METGASIKLGGVFTIICTAKDGVEKWRDYAKNMVVNVGIENMLDATFASGSVYDPWYCLLIDADPTVASTDTMASHGGWTEFDEYTGDRQEWVDVRSGNSITNTASKASFPITTAGTVGGAGINSALTATSGILMCAAALAGSNRSVVDGDTVSLTYTFAGADA